MSAELVAAALAEARAQTPDDLTPNGGSPVARHIRTIGWKVVEIATGRQTNDTHIRLDMHDHMVESLARQLAAVTAERATLARTRLALRSHDGPLVCLAGHHLCSGLCGKCIPLHAIIKDAIAADPPTEGEGG